ncbi:MAG TPA: hypothetical protein PKD90_04865 [Phnomibacter sp.]|nr:hypothetical protein [Phnomibacter sp.]
MASEIVMYNSTEETVTLTKAFKAIKDLWYYFWKRWYIFLLAALIGGRAGGAYAYFKKATYTARILFSLEEGLNSGLGAAASLAAQFGFDIGATGQTAFSGDNIITILGTRRMIERTLLTTDETPLGTMTLLQYYLRMPGLGKSIAEHKRFAGVMVRENDNLEKLTYLQDSLIAVICKKIYTENLAAFKPDKKLSFYEVNFTSPDEYFSKTFAERLLQVTSKFYDDLKTKKSQEHLAILEKRVDSLRALLNSAVSRRAVSQDANLNPAFAVAAVPSQQVQLSIAAYSSAYAELFKNMEIARFQLLKDKPLFQIIEQAKYPLKKNKYGRLFMGLVFSILITSSVFVLLITYRFLKRKLAEEATDAKSSS